MKIKNHLNKKINGKKKLSKKKKMNAYRAAAVSTSLDPISFFYYVDLT